MARFTDTAQVERQGLNFVSAVCEEMGFIWRPTPNTDVGIDGEIELVAGDQATGQIIKVQKVCGRCGSRDSDSVCLKLKGGRQVAGNDVGRV